MRTKILALLAFASAGSALAADRWSGAYIGVQGGYAVGEHEGIGTYTDNTGAYQTLDPIENSLDTDGWFGGLQAGYNLKAGVLLYGVEGDISWGGVDGTGTFISDYDNVNQTNVGGDGTTDYTWKIKTEYDWLATLRGRVGYLVTPNLLLYGTGGVAWARTSSNEEVVCFPVQCGTQQVTVLASSEESHVGWVAGAGGEWKIDRSWSLKAEWQHIDFGDATTSFSGVAYPGTPQQFSPYTNDSFPGSLTLDTFRVGLNYNFGDF